MATGVAGSGEGQKQWCALHAGSVRLLRLVAGMDVRLVSWSLEDGGLEVIYVRTEEMLQAGWRAI
jgi:hypothetical protein